MKDNFRASIAVARIAKTECNSCKAVDLLKCQACQEHCQGSSREEQLLAAEKIHKELANDTSSILHTKFASDHSEFDTAKDLTIIKSDIVRYGQRVYTNSKAERILAIKNKCEALDRAFAEIENKDTVVTMSADLENPCYDNFGSSLKKEMNSDKLNMHYKNKSIQRQLEKLDSAQKKCFSKISKNENSLKELKGKIEELASEEIKTISPTDMIEATRTIFASYAQLKRLKESIISK